MSSTETTSAAASVEALRRLKEVETEWEAKLATARAAAEQRVQAARAAAETVLAQVRQETERQRESTLQAARAAAQAEAERIVHDGEAKARETEVSPTRLSPTNKAKILAVVLAGFQTG